MKINIRTKTNNLASFRLWAVAAAVSAIAVLGIGLSALAWGPVGDKRPTYSINSPADHVVFNSITDNPAYGDERNFLRIKEVGESDAKYRDEVKVQPGKKYEVYIYYHNNASATYNDKAHDEKGIAINTKLRVNVANGAKAGERTRMTGYISADNAMPKEVWDEAYITTDTDVALRYVPGSAKISNRGASNGQTLSDSFLTTGAPLGYGALDGRLPGCNEYSGYVTFEFTADKSNFTFKKEVAKKGQSNWGKSIIASPGEEVDFLLSYQNTGTTQQNNVVVKDTLPSQLAYVSGSTNVANSAHPQGAKEKDGITTTGLNLGSYAPQGTLYAKFTAKMPSADKLACGKNTFTNTASVSTENGSKSDTAEVIVEVACKSNECKPGVPKGDERCEEKCVPAEGEVVDENGNCVPAALPTTGPAEMAIAIIGVTVLSLGVAYWLRSRAAYKKALAGFTEDFSQEPKTLLLEEHNRAHHDSEELK